MVKSQEAQMPQIPRNLRNYGISEPGAEYIQFELNFYRLFHTYHILIGSVLEKDFGTSF